MDTILSQASFRHDSETEFWFEMMFKVTEFPSVNNLHGINTKTKAVFDMPWVTRFKGEMSDQLAIVDPKRNCPWITQGNVYYLASTFILKHHFFSRDLDNCQKVPQDCISKSLNLNDSHIIENHNFKAFKPGDWEYLIIRFGISSYNYNQFR